MKALVVDTHAAIRYLREDPALSPVALRALDAATAEGWPIFVPSICVVETAYVVEKRRIPSQVLTQLVLVLTASGFAMVPAPLTMDVVAALLSVPRDAVPDLPDRVVAATAIALGLPQVTVDREIRASGVETVW